MQDLISVIVPVYGVEAFLDHCVESIVNQTYSNLEIILVDDGSPDNCPAICDLWENRDERIIVIHQENAGLSAARNMGMMKATGKYICFIDSDDYIDSYMLEALYRSAISHNAEIVECEWDEFDDLNDSPETDYNEKDITEEIYTTEQALEEHIKEHYFKQTVVNKIYLKEIAQQELFPIGKIHEDEYWTYKILSCSKVCVHIPLKMYHSYIRPGSIMHSAYTLKRLEGLEAIKERYEYIDINFPQLAEMAETNYVFACKYHHQCLCRNINLDPDGNIRKKLIKEYREKFRFRMLRKDSFKQNMWRLMFYVFPAFTSNIRNLLKVGL